MFKKWILADIVPWFEGIHCWRIQLNNRNKGRISVGVTNRDIESMNKSEINTEYVSGIGSFNNWSQEDKHPPKEGHTDLSTYIEIKCVEMDIHLNLHGDKPEMKI